MSSKRVLTIAEHLGSVGGTESAQLALFQGLARRGWEVHLLYVSPGDLWPAWEALATSATQIRASLPLRSSPASSAVGLAAAVVIGARLRPSVVYVHGAGQIPAALGIAALSRSRPSVVAHLHVPPPSRQPAWLNAMVRRTAAVIVPSSDAARRWVDAAKLDPAKTTVVATGVDPDRFVPLGAPERARVRRVIGVDSQENMVLYVGRVEYNKGAHLLAEAVRQSATPAHLVVCGPAADHNYLAALEESMAGRKARYVGPRSDVPSLMAAADLVVVPSLVPETQGLVIGEAMACGTPVVAFDAGGISDSMRGFPDQLVPAGDSDQLTTAIERHVAWRHSNPELGPRSRAWAVQHLSLDRSIDEVERVLVGT